MVEKVRIALRAAARRGRRDEGQALVEYTLVLSLICLVCIALLDAVGTSVTDLLSRVTNALASAI
jgi:Flp pilus assembly pilin Flp